LEVVPFELTTLEVISLKFVGWEGRALADIALEFVSLKVVPEEVVGLEVLA